MSNVRGNASLSRRNLDSRAGSASYMSSDLTVPSHWRESSTPSINVHQGHPRTPSLNQESSVIGSQRSLSRTTTRFGTASGRRSRTSATPSILGNSDSRTIVCAISEARGVSPTVGIAFVDISVGEVTLSQICDNQSYVKTIHKIQMVSPSRIVFMSTACPPNTPSTLFSLVQDLIEEVPLDSFDRSAWSEVAGLEYIEELAFESDVQPIKVAIQGKFYATTSFAAAMRFIERQYSISVASNSLRIKYQPSEDTMMIDISAIQTLEIMQNLQKPKSKQCLFGLLNNTLTPMGARMLRSNVLQPPTRQDSFINPRYEALEELTTDEAMFRDVRKSLKSFNDVEKLLTKLIIVRKTTDIAFVEEQINQVLMIKGFLESVPDLHCALAPARGALLVKVRDLCRPEISGRILNDIRTVIEPDVTYSKSPLDLRNQRTFAVRAGISGMLDVARQTYKELTEEIHQHVDEISKCHKMIVVLRFDNARKYWLRIKADQCEDGALPELFINCVRRKDNIECQTLDLIKLNLRLSDTSNEVVIRSDDVVQRLIASLRTEAPHLFKVCESVALVDMIASFGQLASTHDYVKPEITSTMAMKAARHPILDQACVDTIVPNDYYTSRQHRFHIVTGCNMSGKSTYIRAIALLQIMAQIGSFVPAEYASFPIVHTIFARVSTDDSIEANLSSFSLEMREMAFILRNVDEHSLAVIDELGRGTSTRDGLAIAIAISEALIQSNARVWFATHFLELARVLNGRLGVLNLHLATSTARTTQGLPQTIMLYRATSGAIDSSATYGIDLAEALGFPESFIKKAKEVSGDLRRRREANVQNSETRKMLARRKLVMDLYGALQQARECGNEDTLPGYLEKLQDEFVLHMEEIDGLSGREAREDVAGVS